MRFNQWLPILIPFLSGAVMEVVFFKPNLIYVGIVAVVLLQFFTARQFCMQSPKEDRWWQVVILPAVFTLGQVAFSILLARPFLVQVLFIANIVFLYFFWRNMYNYLLQEEKYRKLSLENMASYGNFLAFYFSASAVYGMQVFISADTWILMMAMLVVTFLIVYQVAWANRIGTAQSLPYMVMLCIILFETAWSASFLTLSYYILGLLPAVVYYMSMGLVRFYLLGSLNKKTVRAYLLSGFGSILAVLLTANWISHN